MAKATKTAPARAPRKDAKAVARRPGRPTKYDPSMCARVVELGHEGASKAEISAELGISRDTFNQWEKDHPEFSDASKASTAAAQAWWERRGRIATFGGYEGFNATAFIFTMKNRFPADWRDKQEVEHSGLTVNVVRFGGAE